MIIMLIQDKIKYTSCLIHILHHASKHEIYGTWIIQELSHHGYSISPGTLYPWLAELEKQQYLLKKPINVDGKIRKNYSITTQGREELENIKKILKELVDEVLGC